VVGLGVVAEYSLDRDGVFCVPADGALEEGGAVFLALAWQQLGVGEAGVVVDRDVQVLPAGARAALHTVLEDPLADVVETAELLGVDMQQLARTLALITHPRIALRAGQPRAAGATQDLADRRGRPVNSSSDHQGARPQMLAPAQDLRLRLGRKTQRLPSRR